MKTSARVSANAVAKIVADGTDSSWTMPKAPWAERKQNICGARADARRGASLRVSAADKVHNAYAILRDLRNVGDTVWDRFNAPARTTSWRITSRWCAPTAKRAADGSWTSSTGSCALSSARWGTEV